MSKASTILLMNIFITKKVLSATKCNLSTNRKEDSKAYFSQEIPFQIY